MYNKLRQYIKEHILSNAELLMRWVMCKKRTFDTLARICSSSRR